MNLTRRRFLAASGAALLTSASRAAGPNGTIRVALVGAGWRGGQLVPQFARLPDVRIVAVCDPDAKRAAEKAEQVEQVSGKPARIETDVRRVIDSESIDAVVNATPNHWHALSTIWACEAGKDVYVEKPVGHGLWESRQMVRAAEKYGRIVQGGTHRRSFENVRAIMERVAAGEFGRVIRGRVITYRFRESIGRRAAPLAIPAEVDYNLWAGPAPMSPIYRNEFHYDWHWMWETGNGELANNGSHMLDLARWGLGQPELAPAVMTVGGRFVWDDAGETPNTVVAYFDYQPAPLVAEIRNLPEKPGASSSGDFRDLRHGFIIECEEATVLGANHVEVRDRSGKVVERRDEKERDRHPANFIDAVRHRSRERLTCPIDVAHRSCGLALLGNVSHHLGAASEGGLARAADDCEPEFHDAIDRMLGHLEALGIRSPESKVIVGPMLRFDAAAERFVGVRADAANRRLRRAADRKPFVVPEVA